MKHFTALLTLLIILVTVSSLLATGSKDNLTVKRLLSKHNQYMEAVSGGHYDTTTNWDYEYQTAGTDLLSNVNLWQRQEHWAGDEGWFEVLYDDSYTYDYTGSASQYGGMLHYNYSSSEEVSYQYIRDLQFNLIRETRTIPPSTNVSIERFRGQDGRLDRLLYSDNISVYEDYVLHYTDSQTLPSSVSGTRNLTLIYGSTPVQLPFALHPQELFLVDTNFTRFHLLLYMAITPSAYQLQAFTDQDSGLEYHLTWGTVNGEYGYEIAESGESMRFDPDGYPIRYSYVQTTTAPMFNETLTCAWDTTVDNADHQTPAADECITAYPNPFCNALTIASGSKVNHGNICIYNAKGQLVRQWEDSKAASLLWDSKDAAGMAVGNGIYLIRAMRGGNTKTAKVLKVN